MPDVPSRAEARRRSFMPLVIATFLITLVLALATASPISAQATHVLTGDQVAIYNVAGEVTILTGSGPDVVVEVTRGGADAEELTIATGEVRGRPTLRIIYPADRVVYRKMGWGSNTTFRINADGTWGTGGRGDRGIRVSGSGSGMEAYADLVIRVPAGKRLAMFLGVGDVTASDVEGDLVVDTHSGAVKADNVRGSLLVDTGSGSVKTSGIQGELNIDTGSGSVDLANCTGPRIVVDTGSGRVTGENVSAEYLEVDTGSGGIDLMAVSGTEIRLDTGSGSVMLGLLSDVQYVNIDTGSGGVTLAVPATLGARLEVDTGSGGISVDVPCDFTKQTRSYVLGQLGDGDGRIVIDTGSGRVRIRKP